LTMLCFIGYTLLANKRKSLGKGCDGLTRKKLCSVIAAAMFIAGIFVPACFAKSLTHKIKEGDTLWDIAKKYHTTPSKLAKANGIKETATLKLDKKIIIPGQKVKQSKKYSKKSTKVAKQANHTKSIKAEKVYKTAKVKNSTVKGKGPIRVAMALQGIRYRSAGTSRGGFDCSGFTRYVYSKCGVSLPHSSAAQASIGRPIKRSQLKAGDLVFFHTYRRGVSHVGIYIGNNKFVHASNHGRGVTTDSLGSAYYAPRYVCARRIK
jgi:cell wall-associated NlpC family hydrolase